MTKYLCAFVHTSKTGFGFGNVVMQGRLPVDEHGSIEPEFAQHLYRNRSEMYLKS